MVSENRRWVPLNKLHRKNHIDDMTRKWLCDKPSPRFINQVTPAGRPIFRVLKVLQRHYQHLLTDDF